ncbi:MAG: hypothetical protein ACPGO3_00160 [Magnetospiraceae bacterium]
MTKALSQARFDLYALGTRQSMTRLYSEELSYWSDLDETVIGAVIRDLVDDDFGWVMLARDRVGRFRAIKIETDFSTERQAMAQLRLAIADTVKSENVTEAAVQGDEPNAPYDLLTVGAEVNPESLHPYFKELVERPGRAPARAVVREIGPWLAPSDPHFVKEFQQNQFDQRLWELFLWAAFRELGFDVEQLEAPDFGCFAPAISFTVEATTAAPSTMGPLASHPEPKTPEERAEFLSGYMPMKYGSSLVSKIRKTNKDGKHYWELDPASDKPFILAIADFHKPAEKGEIGSMVYTQSALWLYLYGRRLTWEDRDGHPVLVPTKAATHVYREKVIPSGFFDQPGAEHVSAVLFSNAGTIAKLDRMGVVAGFGADKHHYYRVGQMHNPDPNAVMGTPFSVNISEPEYMEFWSDELQIFHNPNAVRPLPTEWFGGIAQHFFLDGNLYSDYPDGHVLSSYTMLMQLKEGRD